MATHVIILAAGQGKRMMSDLPKVAHIAAGKPLVAWVVERARSIDPDNTVVVVGHGAEKVRAALEDTVVTALQEEQLGTGHATSIGLSALPAHSPDDTVVILYGDVPLLGEQLLSELASLEADENARLITTILDDPSGYGRIVRDDTGVITAIVEERDCTAEQLAITEVNAGIYAVRSGVLSETLGMVTADNSQGEYYLTDVIGILAARGDRLLSVHGSPEEVMGINSQDQLADARRALQARTNQKLMESGVWMLDPDRTYIDDTVTVAPGAKIYPGVHLEGSTTVGSGARVGPDVFAVDSSIGEGATVWYSVLRSSVVGPEAEVGPFASLRPGTVLERGAKAGTFVETKNTTLGEGSKAPHLAYLGDTTVGARSNIGAGTVTCNYDGYEKHATEIGDDVFIGSDTMLVAPVKIGDGAVTGAGSVITRDVSPGALALGRSAQEEIPGYSQKRKTARSASDAED